MATGHWQEAYRYVWSLSRPRLQTGFHEDELSLLWKALGNMFDLDRSAARGLMSTRELFVFKHRSALENASAHRLFELVTAQKRGGVEMPRCYLDYDITVPTSSQLPDGVDLPLPLPLQV